MSRIEFERLANNMEEPFVSEFPIVDLNSQVEAINLLIVNSNILIDEMLDWLSRYGNVGIDSARQAHYQSEFGTNIYRYKSLWGFVAIFYFDESRQINFDTVVWR